MKIGTEDWKRLSGLLDEVLDLEPGARAAWLARLSPGDEVLRPALEALLSREAEARFADATLSSCAGGEHVDGRAGQVVAGYRLECLLGQGGSGAVWLAERAHASFRRRVALKLLHPALAGTAFVARFRRERDILARLEHPGIAKLYDAGETDSGQPYLALEYVEGAPINAHCDAAGLPVPARIELFRRVLAAVQYAHGQLVVHRDIKPSNVIVTPAGEPRLLDFGIAKLLQDAADEPADLTRVGQRLLTPEYASPEQIAGAPVGIASDVYSLGVLLYELLAGRRPQGAKRDSQRALEDAVLAGDFPKASDAAGDAEAAALRGVAARRLQHQLKGDLDAILAKALRSDPAQRYPTCESFDDDLARYLRGETVLARRGSRAYALSKFARRHWLPLGATAVIVVAVGVGGGIAAWQASVARASAAEARAQAARAERERAVAVATREFLVDVFRASDPDAVRQFAAGQRTAREVLLDGVGRLRSAFDAQPETKAELYDAIIDILINVDDLELAHALARENVAFVAARLGSEHPQHAAALLREAAVLADLGRADEGRAISDRAARVLDARGDRDSPLRARLLVLNGTRLARTGPDGAQDVERAKQGVALLAANGASAAARSQALVEIAHRCHEQGRPAEALAALDAALEWAQGFAGAELVRSRALSVRAVLQHAQGSDAEAEASARAAVDALQGLPPGHPEGVRRMIELGNFLHMYGKRHEGRTWLALARERAEVAFAQGSMAATNMWMSFLSAAVRDGARAQVQQALGPVRAIVADPHVPGGDRADAGQMLARWYLRAGDAREAAAVIAATLPHVPPTDAWLGRRVALLRARLSLLESQPAAAEPWVRRAEDALSAADEGTAQERSPAAAMRREILLVRSEIAERSRRFAEAVELAEAATRIDVPREPYAEEDVAAAALRLGEARLAAGDASGAAAALATAVAIYAREHDPGSPLLARATTAAQRAATLSARHGAKPIRASAFRRDQVGHGG
jgi:serine/threonine-protein kinase